MSKQNKTKQTPKPWNNTESYTAIKKNKLKLCQMTWTKFRYVLMSNKSVVVYYICEKTPMTEKTFICKYMYMCVCMNIYYYTKVT